MLSDSTFMGFIGGLSLGLFIGLLTGAGLIYLFYRSNNRKTREATNSLLAQLQIQLSAMSSDALRRNSETFLLMANETLSNQVRHGEQNLETKKLLIDQTLEAMRKELGGVSGLVTSLEKDREAKFGELAQQLKQTAEQTEKLQETAENLRNALSNTRIRGQWGERMAEDVLRTAGFIEGVNYLKQETLVESKNRPDYTFLLPRGRKVHMDVKFPLDNYLNFLESDSEEMRAQYRSRFMQDVRSRIKEVTKREYINPSDDTVNLLIVFIPNEQLFAFVCQEDSNILDSALNSKIILCSPLTLFAILAVIRQAIDNFYLEEKTHKILEVLEAFNKQWKLFTESFDGLGKKIEAAQAEYNTLVSRRRNQLDRQLIKIDELRKGQEGTLMIEGSQEAD